MPKNKSPQHFTVVVRSYSLLVLKGDQGNDKS
jgi:hypothetical protein